MDRDPVEVARGSTGHADVHLHATMADTVSFFAGDLHLAMAIAQGDVTYTGPVRKVLRIIPIFRRIVGEQALMLIQQEEGMTLAPLLERLLADRPQSVPEPVTSTDSRDLSASEVLDAAAEYERDIWRLA